MCFPKKNHTLIPLSITTSKFHPCYYVNTITAFKKGCFNLKQNYRSYYRYYRQVLKKICLSNYLPILEKVLSKFHSGFRKKFNTQHCLSLLPAKSKETVDKGEAFRVLLRINLMPLIDSVTICLFWIKFSRSLTFFFETVAKLNNI